MSGDQRNHVHTTTERYIRQDPEAFIPSDDMLVDLHTTLDHQTHPAVHSFLRSDTMYYDEECSDLHVDNRRLLP